MKPHLTHVALHVADLDACIAFYEGVCGLHIVHEREDEPGARVVWMAEDGQDESFVFVILEGGPGQIRREGDVSHLGFAMGSKAEVDEKAALGRARDILVFGPRDDGFPAGYFCGLWDPDGNVVEFSYGQPLGPGAEPIAED